MRTTMKAVLIREYGPNDVVQLADVDKPTPGAGELLVKVQAAGVNPIDWKIRGGAGQRLGMTLPIRLGGELVGAVDVVGAGVDGFARGDIVFGMVRSGAFAEYAVVKAEDMAAVPSNLGVTHAAALPLAGTTAWQALFDEAGLEAGQRLLITNSSGGVGSLAVQLAKDRGAHVTAMASSRNEEFVRSLGAHEFIDYTARPFEEVARDMDVVFDTVGGETFQRAFRTLRQGGSMVTVVAFPDGEAERHGVRAKRSFTLPNASILVGIGRLVEQGKIRTRVDASLPLHEIRQALELSETGRVRGKVVLTIGE